MRAIKFNIYLISWKTPQKKFRNFPLSLPSGFTKMHALLTLPSTKYKTDQHPSNNVEQQSVSLSLVFGPVHHVTLSHVCMPQHARIHTRRFQVTSNGFLLKLHRWRKDVHPVMPVVLLTSQQYQPLAPPPKKES